MSGNIDLKTKYTPDELSRAYRLHAIFSSSIPSGQSLNKSKLYQSFRPQLLEHGLNMSPANFSRLIEQWLPLRTVESLLRRRYRDAAKVPAGKKFKNAQCLHDLLSGKIVSGQHVDAAQLFNELRPDLEELGYSLNLSLFKRLLRKWRGDQRPEALMRINPVRHRLSVRKMLRHVRDFAIRNGMTLQAAWKMLKSSGASGCPPFKAVVAANADHLLIDRFAEYVARTKAAEASMRAEIQQFSDVPNSQTHRRELEGLVTTLTSGRIVKMREMLFGEIPNE